jgi:ribosomal protein L21E
MAIKIADLDPLPLPMEKLRHIFEDDKKQRVRVKATGDVGVLEVINSHKGHVIRLDSGHLVECRDDEIEPEDYHQDSAPAPVSRVLKSYDPLPVDSMETAKPDHAALESLPPYLAKSAELMESENVSDHDRVLIKRAMDNIAECRVVTDPFGEIEDHNTYILRIMAEKYEGGNDVLAKRARSGLRVGQRVRDRFTGRVGKIVSIEGHLVKVEYGDGESYSLMGSTAETLEPIEAAA